MDKEDSFELKGLFDYLKIFVVIDFFYNSAKNICHFGRRHVVWHLFETRLLERKIMVSDNNSHYIGTNGGCEIDGVDVDDTDLFRFGSERL